MSFLRIWRKHSGRTQQQIAADLGENHKTYSAYERGSSPIPPETLSKLHAMGYDGPANQRLALEDRPLTREDFFGAIAGVKKSIEEFLDEKSTVIRRDLEAAAQKAAIQGMGATHAAILAEHVQEAWIILAEAMDRSGAQLKFMDRKAFGLLAGLTAQEIARNGTSAHTRARLLAQAEKFLQSPASSR